MKIFTCAIIKPCLKLGMESIGILAFTTLRDYINLLAIRHLLRYTTLQICNVCLKLSAIPPWGDRIITLGIKLKPWKGERQNMRLTSFRLKPV